MNLRDLSPGDRFTVERDPTRTWIRRTPEEDAGHVWCDDAENPNRSAHMPLSEPVRRIPDRPHGEAEPNTAPDRDIVSGDPASRETGTAYVSASSAAMLAIVDPDRFRKHFPRDPEAGAPVEKDRPATCIGAREAAPGETHASRAGGPTDPLHSPARPTAHGSTPGIFESRAPLLRWFLFGIATIALFASAAMVPLGRFWPEAAFYLFTAAAMLIAAIWRE